MIYYPIQIQNGVEIYNIQIFGSNKDIGKLDVAKIAHLYRCDRSKIKEGIEKFILLIKKRLQHSLKYFLQKIVVANVFTTETVGFRKDA